MESNERGMWATKWALVSLTLTTIIQIVIVWFSGSTALFADAVHNLGDGANSIPLLIAFALQRRLHSRRFTYGYGRTEDLAGVIIVATIAISAVVAGWESIRKLIDPQPMHYFGWVSAAAIVGFIGNESVTVLQIRTGKQVGSAALVAGGQHARIDGITSLAVLIAVGGTLLGVPIIDPLIGLLITITILVILKSASSSIFRRLLDGIEPEISAKVEHAAIHVEGVRGVENARALAWSQGACRHGRDGRSALLLSAGSSASSPHARFSKAHPSGTVMDWQRHGTGNRAHEESVIWRDNDQRMVWYQLCTE